MCDCHPVDNPYQIKLHSPTSCFDEKEINDFCQLTLLPFLSSLHHRFLLTHLSNDNRFNKSYGKSSIFVFLSHYWTDPQNQCSHSCEIIDGENVMRNYPSVTMVEQVLLHMSRPIFSTESSDLSGWDFVSAASV